jgi:hypothetical protein
VPGIARSAISRNQVPDFTVDCARGLLCSLAGGVFGERRTGGLVLGGFAFQAHENTATLAAQSDDFVAVDRHVRIRGNDLRLQLFGAEHDRCCLSDQASVGGGKRAAAKLVAELLNKRTVSLGRDGATVGPQQLNTACSLAGA